MRAMGRVEELRVRLLGRLPTFDSRRERLLGWLGPLLFAVIGGVLRFWRLDRPHQLVFDETYYVKQGVSMLRYGVEMRWTGDGEEVDPLFTAGTLDVFKTAEGDMVVHPPVGKWVIAAGEWLFGPTSSWGWRFAVALLGTLSILMIGRIARRLFASSFLGTAAAFLTAFEGHHFVHSRTALLDIILMFFALAAFGALLVDRDDYRRRLAAAVGSLPARGPDRLARLRYGPMIWWRPWRLVGALMLGLACGTKWSGLYFFAAFGLMSVLWDVGARRAVGVRHWLVTGLWRDGAWAFVTMTPVILATYLASFAGWFASDRGYARHWASEHPGEGVTWLPESLRSLLHYHHEALTFHNGLTSPHTYESNPWSWMIQSRPTSFFYEGKDASAVGCEVEKCSKAITSLGSVSIWWAATAALFVLLVAWAMRRDWRAGAILAGFVGGWLPWFALQHRTIFTFYTISFQPWVILAVVYLLALAMPPARSSALRRQVGYALIGGYALVVLANFAFFWPIWTAQVIPYEHWQWRMWFPSWV
ncbi:dolichyl-phosphate-mannose-protein mannosyltransferase [Marihabitans asiaticum]|uniref:Polyprenol-phosphate-mannose--protein mannosyltransferase n=2 Tax=Marihabitans asiaticum TaxID=415218 RepID=A0A560WHJ6_9MICO|nr:dolichyl-phosphate-mannose-protein mannosyltransferase [Marihabitans asiaticum]